MAVRSKLILQLVLSVAFAILTLASLLIALLAFGASSEAVDNLIKDSEGIGNILWAIIGAGGYLLSIVAGLFTVVFGMLTAFFARKWRQF